MPTPRKYLAAASPWSATVYAIGGETKYLPTVKEYDPLLDEWRTKASMTTAREDLAVAVVGTKLYAIGGFNGAYLDTVEEYDQVTDTWTTKASLPGPRANLAAAVVNVGGVDKLYAIGGFGGLSGTIFYSSVHEYDPATDTWTSKTNMPLERTNLSVGVVNGKIYVFGGKSLIGGSEQMNKTVWEYDPGTNIWTLKSLTSFINEPRVDMAAVVLNDKIYGIGGTDGGNNVTMDVEAYDPAHSCLGGTVESCAWQIIADMLTARTRLAAGTVGGKIYAFGGNNGALLATVEEFDPGDAIEPWKPKASMPEKQDGLAVGVIGGKIYLVGGSASYLAANEAYDATGDVWTGRAPMPTARAGPGVGAPGNGKLYAIGGFNGTYLDTVEEYDRATSPPLGTWTAKAPMPTPRAYLTVVSVNGKLYAIGGSSGTTFYASVEEYDPATDAWSSKAPMPTPRFLHSAVEVNGKIYVIGGITALFGGATNQNVKVIYLDTVEIYDPATDSWTTGSLMPTPRGSAGAASPGNDMIYVAGGFDGSVSHITTERYNPQINQWDKRASLGNPGPPPNGRHGLAVVAPLMSTSVFAIGGEYTTAAGFVANNWSTSGTVYVAVEAYQRDPATLAASLAVEPNPAAVGKAVSVVLTLTNTGDAVANIDTLDFGINAATAAVTPTGGPAPAVPFALTPGESTLVTWTYDVTSAGEVWWSATTSGTDSETGLPVSAVADGTELEAASQVTLVSSLHIYPLPLAAGGVLTVSFTVTNTSAVSALNVKPTLAVEVGASLVTLRSGPEPPDLSALAAASATTFMWTYSVSGSGHVRFTATATGNDPGLLFGVVATRATKSTQPSAPTGLKAEQGDSQVTLTWNLNPADELINGYQIYRSSTPGVPPASASLVATVSGTVNEYEDKGLVNGQVYRYQVVAVNPDGAGSPSVEVTVRPVQLPGVSGEVRITSTGSNPLWANLTLGERVQILVNVPAGNGTLKLAVYTLAGEEVRMVFHASAPLGPTIIEWDGRNARGNLVAAGGYLLVVHLPDGRRIVKKIAILK